VANAVKRGMLGMEQVIRREEATFVGADGLRLACCAWLPDGVQPHGAIASVHGLGDHTELYDVVFDYFARRGWAVYGFDLRGNGRSPGQRGHVDRWSLYREDLRRFVEHVRLSHPEKLVLLGTSLGGAIVLEYALHHPEHLAGVAAAAPALGRPNVPGWMLLLGRALSRIWPTFSLETGLDLSGISRDAAALERITGDRLFHRLASARLSTELTAAGERVRAAAREFRVPVLLLHGSADRLVPPDATRMLAALADPQMVEYREYPGAYHALFADVDRQIVLSDLERWIAERAVE
jgi:alpha-beta hydrolase superfamily lysophospholipase